MKEQYIEKNFRPATLEVIEMANSIRAGMRCRSHYNRQSRDNNDRLALLAGYRGAPTVERIALNMDQIERYKPPPNPAKMTDSRFAGYAEKFGDQSWELDALEPSVLVELIRNHVAKYRDDDLWVEQEWKLGEDINTLDDIIEGLD